MPIKADFGLPKTFAIASLKPVDGVKYEHLPVCPFKDAVGVEVEVENYDGGGACHYHGWDMKDDNSLRNNGREFITMPTHANTIHIALANLLEAHLNKDYASFSPRTSIHVHVNCREFEISQVQDVIRVYALFERLLYRFCGKSRYKNLYCVPLIDTNLFDAFDRTASAVQVQNWPKYTGLNAAPLRRFGTLEFRHMHGTFDVAKVTNWITLLLSIFDYVKKGSTEAIQKDLVRCADEAQFLKFARTVFGEELFRSLPYKVQEDYIHNYNYVMSSYVDRNSAAKAVSRNFDSSAFKKKVS